MEEISLDEALSSLEIFMQNAYPNTKSFLTDRIANIETHYNKGILTKSGVASPDAYIVNFKEESGFAVLGANTSVDEIIAVSEGGSLTVTDVDYALSGLPFESELIYDDDGNLITDFYSLEDDDYYCAEYAQSAEVLQARLIAESLSVANKRKSNPTIEVTTPATYYTTPAPLVKTCWTQGSYGTTTLVNKYCKKNKKIGLAGCSTVALAQIMTAISFPVLTVNSNLLKWNKMSEYRYVSDLDPLYFDHVALLYGAIFCNVGKSVYKNATLITPRQIQLFMQKVGFDNVNRICKERFTDEMINTIQKMLKCGRPVFLSAIPKDWTAAHSWVVDGAKYSPSGDYLLHFNFGWTGTCNGYFSTSCLNPTKGKEYDDISLNNTNPYYNDTYSWHFRMLTYDNPDPTVSINISL